ncbi:VanW family protein [Aestuariimicrobium ganziense]|uniref:VanW family protein n=1 Tax=Aestuariimicrobium ganziense TaxID=2773677 RepID=UPI00194298B7|nr:VanW family protein [Aestuariimicrobium ganziense]
MSTSTAQAAEATQPTGTTFELPTRLQAGAPLSERHPWIYPIAVKAHQVRRWLHWQFGSERWAHEHQAEPLAHRVKQHKSLLIRQMGESEMWLQHNKVTNLRLAAAEVDGILIRPGESFSFNKVVGNCTKARGFVEGMRLSNGDAHPGVGGGICQLANLLHWMFLHSPLTVVERSEHSFDPFPDNGRVLPWGVGCSIAYNYVDLVVRNDTDATFQIFTGVGSRYLEGELRADREMEFSYKVAARDEQFLHKGGEYFRRNEIWRDLVDRRTGQRVGDELVKRNCALVKYLPTGVEVIDLDAQA